MLNIKMVIRLLLFSLIVVQLFGGVVVEANAQETRPGILIPPYIEPTPIKEDVVPGGWTLRAGTPDATSVETLILGTGESSIHGLIYYDGFLWASTRTAPAKVIKINPSTPMSVETSVTLSANRNNAEDLVAANGYIWTIATVTEGNPPSGVSYLVRVDPDTMVVTYYLIRLGSNYLYYAASMEYNFGSLWVGGYNAIARIDISTSPTIIAVYDYSTLVTQQYVVATALSSDSNYLWTMFTQGTTTELISTTLARINPGNPGSDYLLEGIEAIFPDDMVNISNTLYTSSEDLGLPSYAYGFPVNITPYDTQQASSTSVSYGVFHNPLELDTFWGVYTGTPGTLIKFDLNLNDIFSFTLPTGFNDPSEIVFDENGNMYVSTWQNPSGMIRYTIPDAVAVSITRSAGDVVLSWNNTDSLVDHYEVWRSTDRNFNPGDAGATKVDVVASVGALSYTDPGVISDTTTNYFYLVRAFNDYGLYAPISNRVGEINITLATGWNLITPPILPTPTWLAEQLLQEIYAQGTDCSEIDRWTATGWSAHFRGNLFNNFSVTPGSGYFLRCNVVGNWTVVGNVISTSIPISLVSGWNLIGVPYPLSTYLAQGLLNQANSQGGSCTEIDTWTGSGWSAHFNGNLFNNFPISNSKGYFMRCSTSSTLLP